jgi:hypothetical protein
MLSTSTFSGLWEKNRWNLGVARNLQRGSDVLQNL